MGFSATFALSCNSNDIHESTAKWVYPHYVQEILAYALNSRMCVEDWLALFAALVQANNIGLATNCVHSQKW